MREITLTSGIRVKEKVVFRDLKGEAVLLNLETGVYFGLDSVGSRIWNLIQEHESLEKVLSILLEEYEVGKARCRKDLLEILAQMNEKGIIEILD
jgi:hypothetical protein